LFRNGPGLLDVKGHHIHHPFDGDGMISAIAFRDGRAYFRNRFIALLPIRKNSKQVESFIAAFLALKSLVAG
jgi:carotenoid cleavage dioxygenase-like enzyme